MKALLTSAALLLGTFVPVADARANAYASYYDCSGKKPGWTCKSRYHQGHCRLRRKCTDDKDTPVNECLECTDDKDHKTYYPNWRARSMRPFCGCSTLAASSVRVFAIQLAALLVGLTLWMIRRCKKEQR